MSDPRFRVAGALALAALVLVAGGPSLRSGFLNYDDPQIILDNPRLDDPGVNDAILAFSETREYAYLPVYVIALMPDAAFFGKNPVGFHAGSLLWHAIGATLVLAFAHALTRNRTIALLAGAIFAVHPMAAESVAWASGRKDQVSLVFLLLGLAAALGHLRRGGILRVGLSVACAAVAMLAKGSAIVHPLLVIVVWLFVRAEGSLTPRARPGLLIGCAVAVGAAGAALHLWVASKTGTTTAGFTTVWERCLVFLASLEGYFQHLVFPVGLSIHYDVHAGNLLRELAGLVVLAICLLGAWALSRRPRAALRIPALSAAWFLAAVLPFNGVFPATSVAMADRYALNALPAFGMAVGALVALARPWWRVAAAVGILGVLVVLARQRYAQFRDGETVFRAALEADPGDSLAALKLGEAVRDRGPTTKNRAEAVALFRAAAASARDPIREVRARLLLSDALLGSGSYEESVRESDRLLALEQEHGQAIGSLGYDPVTVRFNRAAALLGAGRREEAVAALDEVLRADPSHAPGRLLRAGLDAQQAFFALAASPDDATRDRERERANRSIATYERVIGELRERGRGGADQEIQATGDLARLLLRAEWRSDRLNAALMHAEGLIRRHPSRAEGFLVRAQIMSDVDPSSAVTDLKAAAALDPASPAILRAIAGAFLALGRNRDAVIALERARSKDPDDPAPTSELRALYLAAARSHLEGQNGPDLKLAREALKRAAGLGPEHPEVLAFEAECLVLEKRSEEAAALWTRILDIQPDHPKARLGLARARQQRGLGILANIRALTESYPADRRKEGRDEWLQVVAAEFAAAAALAPESEEVDLARGWLRSEKRRTAVDPLLDRARSAAQRGEIDGALALAEEALALDPTYVDAAELGGHLAMRKGDEARAFAAFQKTLALDPDNLAANDALARIHYQRGDKDAALERARRFLALAAGMQDESPTLRDEMELMQGIVKNLEADAAASRK